MLDSLSDFSAGILGTADQDEHCKKFMEILIPDAFRKVDEHTSWPGACIRFRLAFSYNVLTT